YGSRARLILLYLQTRALQTGSRRVELGRSMYHWMGRLGIAVGGKSYEQVRNQARRLSSCRLTVGWAGEDGSEGFARENLVSGMLTMPADNDGRQGQLWTEEAELTETFMRALVSHPVPVLESAVRRISNQSMALDIYVWLSYRLRSLSKPTPVRWAALQAQFGPEFASLKNFRQHFRNALKEALAVYPDASIDVTPRGLLLRPSAPPVPERRPRSLTLVTGGARAPASERKRLQAS
ncbi:MAG: pirin, partial [Acetobacteraceae bacterium]|nr:pirin [Acetobacteraceae bacterium]